MSKLDLGDKKQKQFEKTLYGIMIFMFLVICFLGISCLNVLDKYYSNKTTIKKLNIKMSESVEDNVRLTNRLSDLEAVKERSTEDISNYIQTYYKTVAPIIADTVATNIIKASETHDVPFVSIVAVTEVESQFNPAARSNKGARGLMQVMPKYWMKELNLKSKYDLHNIQIGINSGAYVMRKYLDSTNNNMKKTLYKYVGGDHSYVDKVYEAMGKFVVFRSFANMTVSDDIPIVNIDTVVPMTVSKADKLPFVHTVTHKGDMLGLVAKWYTGKMSNWKKILEANPHIVPDRMQIGAKITIPKELLTTITAMTKEFINEHSNNLE